MRNRILACTLFCLPLFSASDFDQARDHFDRGEFEKALRVYQSIAGQSAALDYNTGNTLMRLDRPQEAVAYYRRALWQSPADAEVRANLSRALEVCGAALTPLPLWRKATGFPHPEQWQTAFILCCWVIAGLGILSLRVAALRAGLPWILPLLILLLSVLGAGVWASRPAAYAREAVIKSPKVTALFEPLPDATERFSLSGGSQVRIVKTDRNWALIELQEENGWLPLDELLFLKDL